MINNYCLYYIPKSNQNEVNDMLMIFYGENKLVNKREIKNELIMLKNNDEVIGYVIPNFSNYCKIKINGTIYLPNDKLIDLINDILKNHKLDILAYRKNSGLYVGEILTKKEHRNSFIYEVSLGKCKYVTESTFDLKVGSKLVFAVSGTYLMPGRMINDYVTQDKISLSGRIVTYEDLEMNIENPFYPIIFFDEEVEVGSDFFLMEEKTDA